MILFQTKSVDGGHYDGRRDYEVFFVAICSALSLYNALELIVLIGTTFKERRGLYFWSLTLSTLGIFPYCLGFLILYFTHAPSAIGMTIDSIGWVLLVTGQSVVLYSRLHFVLESALILRAVKWMIIVDGVTLHTLTTVMLFGSTYATAPAHRVSFVTGYRVVEKIQMTLFTAQEFTISGLYVWKTIELLRIVSRHRVRQVIAQLLLVNLVVIAMDVGLLAVEYRDLHVLEETIKSAVYSVKLKLEFAILGKLVDLVQSSRRTLSATLADTDTFVSNATTFQSGESASGQTVPEKNAPRWIKNLERAESATEHCEFSSTAPRKVGDDQIACYGVDVLPLAAGPVMSNRHAANRPGGGGGGDLYADYLRSF